MTISCPEGMRVSSRRSPCEPCCVCGEPVSPATNEYRDAHDECLSEVER